MADTYTELRAKKFEDYADPLILQLYQTLKDSKDDKEKLEATISLRKMLAVEKNAPIDQVLNAGFMPLFITNMQRYDFSELQVKYKIIKYIC